MANNVVVCFPMGTPLDLSIDWGDNTTVQTFNATTANCNNESLFPGIAHTYALAGNYTVSFDRNGPGPVWLTRFGTTGQSYWNRFSSSRLLRVRSFGSLGLQSLFAAFSGNTLLELPSTLPLTVTNLAGTLGLSNTNLPSISSWDTSSVTDMTSLFFTNPAFNQPLPWNTANVRSMNGMFSNTASFNQSLNHFRVSSVTSMLSMFNGALAFNQPLDQWDISSVRTIAAIFQGARTFNQDINLWDTSTVTNMGSAFANAEAFNQPLFRWNTTSVTDMGFMFSGASVFNQNLTNWCVSNFGTVPPSSFSQNSALVASNLPRWGTCPPPFPRPPVAPPVAPAPMAPPPQNPQTPTPQPIRSPLGDSAPSSSGNKQHFLCCALVLLAVSLVALLF